MPETSDILTSYEAYRGPKPPCDCPQVGFRDCEACGGSKTKLKVFACVKLEKEATWQECRDCKKE